MGKNYRSVGKIPPFYNCQMKEVLQETAAVSLSHFSTANICYGQNRIAGPLDFNKKTEAVVRHRHQA